MEIKGKIKKFYASKGFGFISYRDGHTEKDIFFHKSDVLTKESRLAEGLEVLFTPGDGKMGPVAKKIKICDSGKTASVPYCMPADTCKIVDPLAIDNIALFLNKAPYFDGKKFCYRLDESSREIRLKPERYRGVPFSHLVERRRAALCEMGFACETRKMQVDWRLVVGLGNASVYETSMTLHHVYGIPYLPGSAVKGVTRNMVIAELFDNSGGNGQRGALADPGFCLIFGSPEDSADGARRGVVRFFDALPIAAPILCLDVMNPHYSPYYTGDKPPADYHNPVPLPFLTVEKTDFIFFVGVPESENTPIAGGVFEGAFPLTVAVEWMERAMREHGIGGKTSVGYGYFV